MMFMFNMYSKKTIGWILVGAAVIAVAVVIYLISFKAAPQSATQKPKLFETEQYKYPFFAEIANQLTDRLNQ